MNQEGAGASPVRALMFSRLAEAACSAHLLVSKHGGLSDGASKLL